MASKVTLFDHFCRRLDEIEVPATPRGYALNQYAQMEFTMSTSDPKCTLANLQFGNLVFVEHLPTKDADGNTNGKLADWVGIILPKRDWETGMVHVTAYSGEAILDFRAMPFVTIRGTPATMFKQILKHANEVAPNIPFHPGIVEDKAQNFEDDLRLTAYKHIVQLVESASMDWDVTGEVDDNGRLQLYANLYERKGFETDLVLSNQNSELASPLLSEQGTPSNEVFGYSQANTSQSRHKSVGRNQDAIDDYGPLQRNVVFIGKHDENSVRAAAQNLADDRGRPVKMVGRRALDYKDTFSKLAPGNIVTVKDTTAGFAAGGGFGFESRARLLSVGYNDLTNNCPLNLELID